MEADSAAGEVAGGAERPEAAAFSEDMAEAEAAGNKAAVPQAAAKKKKVRVRVRVNDDYIKSLLACPPRARPATVPTMDTFKGSSLSPEMRDRLFARCVEVAGMLNRRRDRNLAVLEQFRSHGHGCAYEVVEVDEDELARFRNNGGVCEEVGVEDGIMVN